jgi:hypothetical protein
MFVKVSNDREYAPMKKTLPLLLLALLFSSPLSADLTTYNNYSAYDSTNSLIWITHSFNRKNWTDATTFASDYSIEGTIDWRLPTKTELLSIVSSTHTPMIDPLIQLGPVKNWAVWSSTTKTASNSNLPSHAYIVFFSDGTSNDISIQNLKPFLLVHDYTTFSYIYLFFGDDQLTFGDDVLIFGP